MKIKLKNKKLNRWDSYGGFSVEDFTALNSGEAIEIDNIPDISKDLVEEVKSKTKSKEASKDDSKKENK